MTVIAIIDWNPIMLILAPSIAAFFTALASFIQAKINHNVIQNVKKQTNGQMETMQGQITTLVDKVQPKDDAKP